MNRPEIEVQTYSIDMVLKNTGDGFGMLDILLCDQGQVGYLISVIAHKILQRTLVVLGDLIGWKAGHDEKREARVETQWLRSEWVAEEE